MDFKEIIESVPHNTKMNQNTDAGMEIDICFGASTDYMQHVGCIIASILANSKNSNDNYNFYIISNSFLQKDKDNFEKLKELRLFEINFLEIDDRDFDGLIQDWLGVSASYRLKAFDLINKEKILYLDSDIIVRTDIRELYSTDVSEYYCAAVEDKLSDVMRSRVNMPETETFINSGVLILNLKKCKENGVDKEIFKELKQSTFWTDQDAINYCMQGHIKLLDLKWNLMYPHQNGYKDQEYYHETAKNPSIIHYTLTDKPWVSGSNPYMKSEYYKYLKLTPWYNEFMVKAGQ